MNNLREVGTLPEDTSRGLWTVKVPETRNAGTRYLGRLGGDQKVQATFANSLFWPVRNPVKSAASMHAMIVAIIE